MIICPALWHFIQVKLSHLLRTHLYTSAAYFSVFRGQVFWNMGGFNSRSKGTSLNCSLGSFRVKDRLLPICLR